MYPGSKAWIEHFAALAQNTQNQQNQQHSVQVSCGGKIIAGAGSKIGNTVYTEAAELDHSTLQPKRLLSPEEVSSLNRSSNDSSDSKASHENKSSRQANPANPPSERKSQHPTTVIPEGTVYGESFETDDPQKAADFFNQPRAPVKLESQGDVVIGGTFGYKVTVNTKPKK